MLLSYDALFTRECKICGNRKTKGFLNTKSNNDFICEPCESEKFMFFVKHTRSDGVVVQRVDFAFPKFNQSPESLINHWNIIGGGHYEYKLLTG